MDDTTKYTKIDLIMVNSSMVSGNKIGGELVSFGECNTILSGNHLIIVEHTADLKDVESKRHTIINLDNIKQYKTYK